MGIWQMVNLVFQAKQMRADFGKNERSEIRPSEENHTFPSCR